MRIHIRDYPPHCDTVLDFPERGVVVIYGDNGAGKSSIVEAYPVTHWGRSLRGANAWRSDKAMLRITHALDDGELRVERTPSSLHIRDGRDILYAALTPTKTQQFLTGLVGDFATWKRTRVFDADLTARFGAESDAERKKMLESLVGMEKLTAGLKRCRDDLRTAKDAAAVAANRIAVSEAALAEQPKQTATPDAAELFQIDDALRRAQAQHDELAKRIGEIERDARDAQHRFDVLSSGRCPTCEQTVPEALAAEFRGRAKTAADMKEVFDIRLSDVVHDRAQTQRSADALRRQLDEAQRAAQMTDRRSAIEAQLAEAQVWQHDAKTDAAMLAEAERFIEWARPKLLTHTLARLEATAARWIPGLTLRVVDDGLQVKLDERTYRELNEGHRRLCDLAVLLALSGTGDAKVKGPIWLEGCLYGLDGKRRDLVVSLLESVAERECVVVTTCEEDVARYLPGLKIKVDAGRCEVIQ
jgi:DNA repair exonuclease SbcCD ATPase subunit